MSKYNAASYESLTRHDRRDIDSNTEVKTKIKKNIQLPHVLFMMFLMMMFACFFDICHSCWNV
ncbi:Uncharacterised protein [Staphylococcus gallinarum]|uniref:Uncharacterized protein n=1 Tax=Staphylococcus gallinarum TaxID=1293 RepID=A0A380FML0_STAGA|nr:Uncharacterised protein [Staphylococcus gallinarum]